MNEALSRAALNRAVHVSAQVENQLRNIGPAGTPVLKLLEIAREHAAQAIVSMADVDAEDPKAIRALQNEIRCFDRITEWLKQIVVEGYEADILLEQTDREPYANMILGEEMSEELPQHDE